jgi:hypothetical protein
MKARISTVLAIALTLVAVLAFSRTHHAQNSKSIVMAVAYVQDAAPVHINSTTHGTDFLFRKAEVKNVSRHVVRSVTFGVFLHETAPNHGASIMASSREIPTNMKPGETRNLDVLDLSLDQAQEKAARLKSESVIAEFGILSVKLDDGSVWSCDAQRTGTFGRIGGAKPSAQLSNGKPKVSSQVLALF